MRVFKRLAYGRSIWASGTVEPDKADAFDRQWRPPKWSRGHWTRMWLAARRGTALPPISVYRVGDGYFVRDGHHRVSVMRAIGALHIDAELRPQASIRTNNPD